ncbi:hypothetical protein [Exiguobacterium chiriqhucha]|uniref:hypothetical protein n=1 Tax=Exiguobacterium chiriqhucha TaxID=1385984 RepID=UPI0023F4E7B1|nr:hypothetical protein [Exiguobacterium chiriqhucha]
MNRIWDIIERNWRHDSRKSDNDLIDRAKKSILNDLKYISITNIFDEMDEDDEDDDDDF